jgi:uncharacterized protein YqeY
MLRDAITSATKDAMKAGDKARLSTLRLMSSAIKNADIEARTGGKEVTDEALMGLLQKLVKQRQESADLYDKGSRPELAAQERAEIVVIREFMPKQMDEAEMRAAAEAAIGETGASGIRDMGKVIGKLKEQYAGRMDFGKASGIVKGLLGG